MIRAGDRVARVLERDERLLEVFASASPHFERLRNPAMRRVMARLVTVEQAARIAGVDAGALLARLNAAAGAPRAPENRTETDPPEPTTAMQATATPPPELAELPPERVLDLDVREDLRAGREPFARIMAARQALPEGHVLRLRATFEPVPLYHVLGKQGFDHWTEQLAPDDWRVWFHQAGDSERATGSASHGLGAGGGSPDPAESGDGVVVLDVRGLEPPEPMARTLAALERLPEGGTLVQLNVRVPQFLLPRLDDLGFAYEVREQSDELVRLFIRRR